MTKHKFPTDRQINSTENNGYAEGVRDENLWEKDLIDSEIPEADRIPDEVNETGVEQRPVYNESVINTRSEKINHGNCSRLDRKKVPIKIVP